MRIRMHASNSNPFEKVRSVREAESLIEKIRESVLKMTKPLDVLFKALSRTSVEAAGAFDVTDGTRKIKVKEVFKAPSKAVLTKIVNSLAMVEDLTDKLDELSLFRKRLSIKFRGHTGSTKMMAHVDVLEKDIKAQLKKANSVLDKLSHNSVPEGLRDLATNVERELKKRLKFQQMTRTVYVVPGKNDVPVFYVYITLVGLVADDAVYPEYQVVLSSNPTDVGFDIYVTTMRKFIRPGIFKRGQSLSVEKIRLAALNQVMHMLEMSFAADDLSEEFRTVLPRTAQKEVKTLGIKDVVKSFIKDDFVYVEIKVGTKAERLKEIEKQLFSKLEGILGVSREQSIKGKLVKSTSGKNAFRFSLNGFKNTRLTQQKLDGIQALMDLSDEDMDNIRSVTR